jgi:hypothetical protein
VPIAIGLNSLKKSMGDTISKCRLPGVLGVVMGGAISKHRKPGTLRGMVMGTMNPTQTVLIADLRLDLEESSKKKKYIY